MSLQVHGWALVAAISGSIAAMAPRPARAAPGQTTRMSVAEAQGPATRGLTALHHNPAMLAGMPGTRVQAGMAGGLDQRWIRRQAVGPDGIPSGGLGGRESLLNPTTGYFLAASFYFEPFALGFGVNDVGSQYNLQSTDAQRWHLAPEPDRLAGLCRDSDSEACRVNGGAAASRTDFTLAIAWNILANLRLGVGIHLPRLRSRFAYDNSRGLARTTGDAEQGRCNTVESPGCAERLGFAGLTRWLPSRDGRPSGFDLALTLGLAIDVTDRVTLGLRYRTRPLLNGGDYVLAGKAAVCRPDETESSGNEVQPCSVATPIDATMREGGAREVALGVAAVLGRGKLWRIDTNFYWLDLCHDSRDGVGVRSCGDPGDQRLSLVGLDRDSVLLPETVRYRGHNDVFGFDAYTTYRMRSNVAVMLGSHASSPATRRAALNPAESNGWRVGLSLGATLRVRQSNFQVVPGYAFDMYIPTTVPGDRAAFDPAAAAAFNERFGDLNTPEAALVLAGRGRPSNAGRYTGAVHTFMFGLRWSERVIGFD
jgi:opacity protein-like surface antigen